MTPPFTVYLVDDDPLVCKAVSRLLRYSGFEVADFGCPKEFLSSCDSESAACLILDMAMPVLSGLDIQRTLTARKEELPIIFLTGHADVPMTVEAMKGGAVDFLTKPVNKTDLVAAVRDAIEKGELARQARAELDDIASRLETLTPREREVLEHVVAGHLNKQIAGNLGTCEQTIKVHRRRVMKKMHVDSVACLTRLAEQAGIQPRTLGK